MKQYLNYRFINFLNAGYFLWIWSSIDIFFQQYFFKKKIFLEKNIIMSNSLEPDQVQTVYNDYRQMTNFAASRHRVIGVLTGSAADIIANKSGVKLQL